MSTYSPMTCVWEITMGCNMRCQHCGSSCKDPLPDELTTEEALELADQIADLGLSWVTLSGGEPLTRKDWPQITHKLRSRGVTVNMISNGWLIDDAVLNAMRQSGLATLALSLDGPAALHDKIRKPGAYAKVEKAFAQATAAGVACGAVTTVTKENLHLLDGIKETLLRCGVGSWQLQIGLPMGNLADRPEWLLDPAQMEDLLDYCYRTALEGRIIVHAADCIGYYSRKEQLIRQLAYKKNDYPLWDGCNAGLRSFGVLHNGDILGCTSIRDAAFVEGSIRKRPLADIWRDEDSFAWRRRMKKSELAGDCAICKYGDKCLGGCPNTRLTMHGSIYGENDYCVYNVALKQTRANIAKKNDAGTLFRDALADARNRQFQAASLKLDRMLELSRDDMEGLKLQGFTEFMNGNFERCAELNRRVLELSPGEDYARKGLGLALHRLGRTDEGIALIEGVVHESRYRNKDAVHDLLSVYHESGRYMQAQRLVSEANRQQGLRTGE